MPPGGRGNGRPGSNVPLDAGDDGLEQQRQAVAAQLQQRAALQAARQQAARQRAAQRAQQEEEAGDDMQLEQLAGSRKRKRSAAEVDAPPLAVKHPLPQQPHGDLPPLDELQRMLSPPQLQWLLQLPPGEQASGLRWRRAFNRAYTRCVHDVLVAQAAQEAALQQARQQAAQQRAAQRAQQEQEIAEGTQLQQVVGSRKRKVTATEVDAPPLANTHPLPQQLHASLPQLNVLQRLISPQQLQWLLQLPLGQQEWGLEQCFLLHDLPFVRDRQLQLALAQQAQAQQAQAQAQLAQAQLAQARQAQAQQVAQAQQQQAEAQVEEGEEQAEEGEEQAAQQVAVEQQPGEGQEGLGGALLGGSAPGGPADAGSGGPAADTMATQQVRCLPACMHVCACVWCWRWWGIGAWHDGRQHLFAPTILPEGSTASDATVPGCLSPGTLDDPWHLNLRRPLHTPLQQSGTLCPRCGYVIPEREAPAPHPRPIHGTFDNLCAWLHRHEGDGASRVGWLLRGARRIGRRRPPSWTACARRGAAGGAPPAAAARCRRRGKTTGAAVAGAMARRAGQRCCWRSEALCRGGRAGGGSSAGWQGSGGGGAATGCGVGWVA